ncbi:Ig-like domain-containing protein [Enterobacteriaceae bacterium H11S18]|uniref:Ig-like domain-containing protein n=1 Tax=Dryocola clanedunensis TaxID=2925396 RepID=UPI0022F0672B|nr:Ig-like domain-containing protein [Dryocola clanedunensis]MCT4711326.1 Ig-like domain-containing protein [Dryocola clanedunensis]
MSESTNNERDAVLAAAASNSNASSPSVGIDYSTTIHIDSIVDDTGKYVGTVLDGGLTDDLQPTLKGYLPEGKGIEIRVFANGSVIGYTTVGEDNNWSFTPSTPLEAGRTYEFQVFMFNPGDGNTLWPSNTYTVTTTEANQDVPADATPPDAPVIDSVVDNVKGFGGFTGNLKDGALTDDAHPALSGHAEAGTTVNIYDNGALLGSTTAAADGSWAFTPANALNDGAHALTVTAANAVGESTPAEFSITVDTVISKPVLDTVTDNQGLEQGVVENGGLTDDSRPVLTGHAEAGSRVDIHVFGPNGKQLYYQSVTADADGSWTYQPKAFTTHGTYSFGISGVDQAGNAWRDYGDKYSVNFVGENQDVPADTTPPDAPIIQIAAAGGDGFISGDTIHDATPALVGKAEANSLVKIYEGNTLLGSTVATSEGFWSLALPERSEGLHILTATATDAAGNVSGRSDGFVVNIDIPADTTPPDAPVITTVYDDVGTEQGNVANGGKTDDSHLTISGTAEAGSVVVITHVIDKTGAAYTDGSVVADASGHWTFQMEKGFVEGQYGNRTITATATDAAGNVSEKSADYVVNYVASNMDDTTAPDAPVITTVYDTAHAGGSGGSIHSGDTISDTQVALTGNAEASSIVRIYDGSTLLGSVAANSAGRWTFVPPESSEGAHYFTATATDAAGNVSGRSDGFVVNIDIPADTTPPDAPVITAGYDDVGPSQGSFGSGTTTDDTTPQLSGKAEAGSLVKIYDGSTLIGSATADSSGNWSFTTPVRSDGQHTFTATATDAAGNVSGQSGSFVVNIDSIIILPGPVISQLSFVLAESRGAAQGHNDYNLRENSSTTDRTLTVTGTAYDIDTMSNIFNGHVQGVKLTVNVYDAANNNALLGSVTSTDYGYWSFDTNTLSYGKHEFYVTVTDPSGVVTPQSNHFTVNVESATSMHSLAVQDELLVATNGAEHDNVLTLSQIENSHNSTGNVDITDHQQNTLQLTLNDILSEAHDNLFVQDGHKQLAVTGDAGDVVELKVEDLAHNTWQDAGQVTAGGVQYEVYHHTGSDVELLVQHGLELHQVS